MINRETKLELVIIVGLFILINIVSQITQQPLTHNKGQGWDGIEYFKMAEQMVDHIRPVAKSPFVYRVGTPFLVSLFFGEAIIPGFKTINILGNLISTVLFVFWLRQFINNVKIRLAMAALFLFMWHSPTRFVYFYPVHIDPWLFVFIMAGLLGIKKLQTNPSFPGILLLGLLSFLGFFFRESVVLIPIAFLFASNPILMSGKLSLVFSNKQIIQDIKNFPLMSFIPLLCSAIALVVLSNIVTSSNIYSFLNFAIIWAVSKPITIYLHALFIAFGPIIFLLIYKWRWLISFLAKNQFLLVFLISISILALIGGSDTERIFFWGAPVVYLLIGKCMEDNPVSINSKKIVIAFIAAQIISMRVFWTIPDFPKNFITPMPILTILSNEFQYFDLYSHHGNRSIENISFYQYVTLGITLLVWLFFHERNIKQMQDGKPDHI